MIGLSGFYPKFVKKYVNLSRIIEKLLKNIHLRLSYQNFHLQKIFYNGRRKNSKLETKDTLISIVKRNKKTIIIFLSILLILFFSFIILNLYYEKRNISISEKYIKALYLANGKKRVIKSI